MGVEEAAEAIEEVFTTEVEFAETVGEDEPVDIPSASERAAQRLQDLGLLA